MGLFVGRDQRMFSLCLPSSANLSACSFRGSPRWAFILMKIVRRPWSILSRRSWTMSLMMSASGFPCIEGDFPLLSIFGRRRGSRLSLIKGLQVSYPVVFWSILVLGMPLLVQPYLRRNVVYWNPNGRSSMISCAIKSFKRHSQGMSLFMVCVFVF